MRWCWRPWLGLRVPTHLTIRRVVYCKDGGTRIVIARDEHGRPREIRLTSPLRSWFGRWRLYLDGCRVPTRGRREAALLRLLEEAAEQSSFGDDLMAVVRLVRSDNYQHPLRRG